MTRAARPAIASACAASVLVLALVLGLATGVDRDGNLDAYWSNPVVLLAFCALDITALCALGIIGRPSASAMGSSLISIPTILVYWLTVIAKHPGEFASDSPLPVEVGVTALLTAGLVGEAVLLAGLLGAGASAAYLGGRWLRDSVRSRLGAHL